MRILITGGAGLVGSHCAEFFALNNPKNKVIVLDNLMRSQIFGYDKKSVEFNWIYLKKFRNIKRIKGDVRNDRDVKRAIGRGVDVVIHTAGQPGVPSSVRMPKEDFSINAFGTLNVLEAMRRNLVRNNPVKLLLYASSSEIYGTAQYVPMDEKHPINPQSPYAAGKAAADRLCSSYHHVYKIPVIILRQFNTYGPNQMLKGYSAVIPKFISQVYNNCSPTIYGDGTQTKDFHYIDDLISAYELIIDKWSELDLFGRPINFGTGKETSINKLSEIILEVISKRTGRSLKEDLKPVYLPKRPGEVMRFAADTSLAKKTLGFSPKIDIKEGIEKYFDWFIKEHYAPSNI